MTSEQRATLAAMNKAGYGYSLSNGRLTLVPPAKDTSGLHPKDIGAAFFALFDEYEERAAFFEHDANMIREIAERRAMRCVVEMYT